jgi:hypothetical protein
MHEPENKMSTQKAGQSKQSTNLARMEEELFQGTIRNEEPRYSPSAPPPAHQSRRLISPCAVSERR